MLGAGGVLPTVKAEIVHFEQVIHSVDPVVRTMEIFVYMYTGYYVLLQYWAFKHAHDAWKKNEIVHYLVGTPFLMNLALATLLLVSLCARQLIEGELKEAADYTPVSLACNPDLPDYTNLAYMYRVMFNIDAIIVFLIVIKGLRFFQLINIIFFICT